MLGGQNARAFPDFKRNRRRAVPLLRSAMSVGRQRCLLRKWLVALSADPTYPLPVKITLFRLFLLVSALLMCSSCSSRAPLNRPLYETDVTVAVVRFVLAEVPETALSEARIAYLSLGDYVADVASPDFLQKFADAPVRFVDGTNFRDKEFAGKRFIVDTSTDKELTPLMLQIRAITSEGTGYHVEVGWAFKEMLSRKVYHVETMNGSNEVTVEKDIDLRGLEGADVSRDLPATSESSTSVPSAAESE